MPKITRVEVFQVDLQPKVARSDAIQTFSLQETPMLRLFCDDGSEGTGYSYTIGNGSSSVIALLRDHLAPRLLGKDAEMLEEIWKDLFFFTHATSVGAITSIALWFEEPLPAEDLNGHLLLSQSTSLPIAVGESLYHPSHFREYLQRGACNIIQVDVGRVGGITPWLKVAHLAETFNVQVCPHYLMEIHLGLCCAVANATWLEHIPQLDDITASRVVVQSGYATPSNQPGLGIEWDWKAIERRRNAPPDILTLSRAQSKPPKAASGKRRLSGYLPRSPRMKILDWGLSCVLALGLAAVAGADTESPAGLWKTIDDKTGKERSLVRIVENNGVFEGKVERIFEQPGDDPGHLCKKCEGERKDKPILGMTFLWGLKKDGDQYGGGEILDPKNGKVYRAKMRVTEGGRKLEVRGYVGLSLFGRSQTWLRQE